jgi:hypothetical protein
VTRYLTQMITDVGGDQLGDCWRTALACLLELQVEQVPHFADEQRDVEGGWWTAAVEFALAHGHVLADADPVFPVPDPTDAHCIAIGPSPRGPWTHAVIVTSTRGSLVWDPHPSRTGLAGPPSMLAILTRGPR